MEDAANDVMTIHPELTELEAKGSVIINMLNHFGNEFGKAPPLEILEEYAKLLFFSVGHVDLTEKGKLNKKAQIKRNKERS